MPRLCRALKCLLLAAILVLSTQSTYAAQDSRRNLRGSSAEVTESLAGCSQRAIGRAGPYPQDAEGSPDADPQCGHPPHQLERLWQ